MADVIKQTELEIPNLHKALNVVRHFSRNPNSLKLTKITFIFLSTLTLFSCIEDKKKSIEDRANLSDTTCFKEIKKAKKDLANNEIVYCHYVGNIILQSLRAQKEMDSLLKLHNIKYQDESSPCVIDENRSYHCYCEYMHEQINSKYGDKFIDSLLYIADSLYILKNIVKTFDNKSIRTKWDTPPLFPGDTSLDQTNHSGLQQAFNKLVKYPSGYKYKNGNNSGAMLKFHLDTDKTGNTKITDTEYLFWDYITKEENYNKEFYKYFKNLAVSLIENTKWTPAKIKKLSVNSKSEIFVYLK